MDIHVNQVKKIDFILPLEDRYSGIAFLTKQLASAFKKLGVDTRVLVPHDKDPKPFLDDLFAQAPDCTICFNGILPDQEGRFLADLIQIPHFAILTESPNDYLTLGKSKFTTALSPDQQYVDILKEAGCQRTLFFPLAAPSVTEAVPALKLRKGNVLIHLAWTNGEAIQEFWEKNLPKKMVPFLNEVIDQTLQSSSKSYYHAFQLSLANLSAEEQKSFLPWISFALFQQIEEVMKERDAFELLSAFKDVNVDLIVEKGTLDKWKKRLGTLANQFKFHEGISQEDILRLMEETKIFLASSPQFKFGTNGDLYTALMLGAYTFHSPSDFLQSAYEKQHGVYFYPFKKPEEIREKALEILANPEKFQEEVNRGRQLVAENETWASRAKLLIDFIAPILQQLPNKPKSLKK